MSAPKRKPRAPREPAREVPEPFLLDFDVLQEQGFFCPSEKPERLSLELRAIKRRLLRRLKFRKRAGRRGPGSVEDDRRQPNLVLVTSTRPAEGKTYTAINLALSLAVEDDIGTVLIDGDVPRPKIMGHLGLPNDGPGLTDLIARPGHRHLRHCLLREEELPIAVLPEGTVRQNSAELFARPEAGAFLAELSQRFPDRIIILDAPPVLATADAVTLARHVDEIVFVVEANATAEPAVATALDELMDVNENISLVLNRCLVSDGAIHYGSYDEYYYRYQTRGKKRAASDD